MRNNLRPIDFMSIIVSLATSIVLSGCIAHISSSPPSANIKTFKTFYIVQSGSDSREVYKAIEGELVALGRMAKSGPRSSIPAEAEVLVTYHEHWVWDLGWYLHNILVQFRNPKTNVLLASSLSSRSSLQRQPPELMVREVLDSLLK